MNLHLQKREEVAGAKGKLFSKFLKILPTRAKTETGALNPSAEQIQLISNVNQAKLEWANANNDFEFACDSESIDYYIYKIKACQAKYEYLLRQAKKTI